MANAAHEDASSQPSDTNSTAPVETAAKIAAIGAMYFVEIVYAIGLLALAVRIWGSLTKHEATVVCAYLLMSPVILEFVALIAPGNVSNFQGVHDETMTAVVSKVVVPTASYISLVYGLPELKPKLSARMTLPVKLGVFAGILGTASAQGTWVTSRVEAWVDESESAWIHAWISQDLPVPRISYSQGILSEFILLSTRLAVRACDFCTCATMVLPFLRDVLHGDNTYQSRHAQARARAHTHP